jgi:DNA-binding NarL/FixJ family response regulator
MKRLYTIEINNKTYEAGSQDEVFSIVRSHMKGKMSVSFNISWKNIEVKRAYKGLDEHKDEIVDMLCEGNTYKDVAKKYGVSSSTVASFCRQNKLISHKALVYTEPEDRKEKFKAIENVWFGAKKG